MLRERSVKMSSFYFPWERWEHYVCLYLLSNLCLSEKRETFLFYRLR